MLPMRRVRPSLALSVLVAFAFAVLLVPAIGAGAEERRDRRGNAEETPEPVILQVATEEPEPVDGFAAETGDSDPDPEPDNSSCPEDWVQPAGVNDDIGCLPGNATGGAAGGGNGDDEPATRPDAGTATLVLPPKPEEHPGHCPEGYSYELLLHQDERGNLTWLYGCVWDGTLDPTGPDDVATGGGSAEHPGHGCPEGYVQKLLLRQNADGSLTWLYGCVPDGIGPTGPGDEAGTAGDWSSGGSPRIVPTDDLTSAGDGTAGGGKCPAGHTWTDGTIEFPNWPIDTDGDGNLDDTGTIVVNGGCVPDGGECPDGSAIHPYYTEYGCIPYGQGPWAS